MVPSRFISKCCSGGAPQLVCRVLLTCMLQLSLNLDPCRVSPIDPVTLITESSSLSPG